MTADSLPLDGIVPRGGRLADLFDAVGWGATPVGDPKSWPAALRIALRLVCDAPDAMYLVWGHDRTFFLNEPYIPILGPRL